MRLGQNRLQRHALAIVPSTRARPPESAVRACSPDVCDVGAAAAMRPCPTEWTASRRAARAPRPAEAEETKRIKAEILLALSHELRNPLQALHVALEVLNAPRVSARRSARLLAVMRRQLSQLRALADELLDATRLTRGVARIDHKRLDLRRVVLEAIESYAPVVHAQRRRLVVQCGASPIVILGDARRMSQVVIHLLSNAVKYTKRGGHIHVILERTPQTSGRDEAVLRVQDDGIGIPTEFLQAVFLPFVQLAMTAARTSGGLGMGLPIVREIIRAHGAEVEARSGGRGCGTEIVVHHLAIAREPTVGRLPRQPTPAARPPASARRILVIEDNDDARDGLVSLLELWGYEALGASDGEEGLRVFARQRPDVALVDLGLPHVDGYEVARRVRVMARGKRVRLIAVTGYGGAAERERARRAGFDEHLVKPVDTDRLAGLLATHRGRSPRALMG